MKKSILFLGMLLAFSATISQKKGKEEIITYTCEDGTVYTVGDTLRFGRGSNPNGNFNYVYLLPNFFNSQSLPYNSSLNGKFAIIDKIQKSGSDKIGYTPYFGFRYPAGNSGINVETAIQSGELITPASKLKKEQADKPVIIQQNQSSLADELKKLKELLDSGVLTKEEYDTQKQKLLNK